MRPPDEGAGGAGPGEGGARLAAANVLGAYDIVLEVAGITAEQKTIVGGFKSMSGTDSETAQVSPGGLGPGGAVITFKTGASPDAGLLAWYKRVEAGLEEPRGGTITVFDRARSSVVKKYVFQGALPLAVVGAPSSPPSSVMAIEKVELCTEKIERVSPPTPGREPARPAR